MHEELKQKLDNLYLRSHTLTVFRQLLSDPALSSLLALLKALSCGAPLSNALSAYGAFTAALYRETSNLSDYLRQIVLDSDNFYIRQCARSNTSPRHVTDCADSELAFFESLAGLTSSQLQPLLRDQGYEGFLPGWDTSEIDFSAEYLARMDHLAETGCGIFSRHHMFSYDDRTLIPVRRPDSQSLTQLSGYQRERQLVIDNTLTLLSGGIASNVLLYGDAGTGKSSTVKAIANSYRSQGLRLVEVKKNNLHTLPLLLEELADNPLKFIVFIDDLSFKSNDDNFSALKAVLEGGVAAAGPNTVIYATSNRRHLVKETLEDRRGDELHLNDTLQETMSLASRFGLTITFQRPDRELYLSIVENLAAQYDLALPEDELHRRAEAFAIRQNGRSPRTAKHFIELLKAGLA